MNKVVLTELEYQAAAAARIAERTRASLRSAGADTEKSQRLTAALAEWEDQAQAWTEILSRAVLTPGVVVDPLTFVDTDPVQGVFFCLFPRCPQNTSGQQFTDTGVRSHMLRVHGVQLPGPAGSFAGSGTEPAEIGPQVRKSGPGVAEYRKAYARPHVPSREGKEFWCTQCNADNLTYFTEDRLGERAFMDHLLTAHGIGPGKEGDR